MSLGGQPYHFEPLDILRSLSVAGRLETPRTMQVVAPSRCYLVLLWQFYLVFPPCDRCSSDRRAFLAVCFAVGVGSRTLAFAHAPFGAFDANATVLYAVPPVALPGSACWLRRAGAGPCATAGRPSRGPLCPGIPPGGRRRLARCRRQPAGHHRGVDRPCPAYAPRVTRVVGRLRRGVGGTSARTNDDVGGTEGAVAARRSGLPATRRGHARRVRRGIADLTGPLLPVYVAAALVLTKPWDPLPAWCAARWWPVTGQ